MKTYLKQLSQFAVINFIVLTVIVAALNAGKSPPKQQSAVQPTPVSVSLTPSPFPSGSSAAVPTQAIQPTAAKRDFAAELGRHNTPSDCWLLIGGRYFDITTYFGSHPGGDGELAKYCGKDGTAAFASKDQGIPRDHSAEAKAMLEQYLIQ